MNFNGKNNEFAKPYFSYIDVCKEFGVDPQLGYLDYKNLYSVFAIDLSEQDEKLAINGVNVTIEITKDTAFKAKCVCVILVEKEISIELTNGKMTTIK